LFVVFAGKKQPKHVGKMPEIRKKHKSEVCRHVFLISAKCANFQVSVLVSSRNFSQVSVLVSKVAVSTTSQLLL